MELSKNELNIEFESWIISEEFTPEKEKYQGISDRMSTLVDASHKEQLAAYVAETESEDGFEYDLDKDDSRFQELKDIYHEKRKKAEQERKAEQDKNTKIKQDLIKELHELIQDEENISLAYKRFDVIKVRWSETGSVAPDKRRDLQAEYSRLIEQFYYNIKIYRELQVNDLKKNQELKLEVIQKIKALEKEEGINKLDFLIHQYLDEWDQIGPTFKEEWEKIREDFKTGVSAAFERIREHRKEVKQDHNQHFEAKSALVTKVAEIASQELNDVRQVQLLTSEVINAQKDWKKIGYAGRGKNDSVWVDFRKACDQYFDNRKAFLDESNKGFDKVKEVKQNLLNKAKEALNSVDFEATAHLLKGLQREWKQSGKLLPQDEYKLYKEFRKYCDSFFNKKKAEAEASAKQFEENLKEKMALLDGFAKELEAGLKDKGEAALDSWKEKWAKIGDVAGGEVKRVESSLNDLFTKAYESLGITKEALAEKQFEAKLDILSSKEDPSEALRKERSILIGKVKEAQLAVVQMEGKLEFFKFAKDDSPLKKEVLDKIAEAQHQVDILKDKKKRVDLTIKELEKLAKVQEVEVVQEDGASDPE